MPNTELSELSEFFSAVSKEKNENLEKLETKITPPNMSLADLFKQLETAHKETIQIFIFVFRGLFRNFASFFMSSF